MESKYLNKMASVTSKGQVTVPKQVRERLGVETPGMVRFRGTEDGGVVVEGVRDLDDHRGSLDAEESAADLVEDARVGRSREEGRE